MQPCNGSLSKNIIYIINILVRKPIISLRQPEFRVSYVDFIMFKVVSLEIVNIRPAKQCYILPIVPAKCPKSMQDITSGTKYNKERNCNFQQSWKKLNKTVLNQGSAPAFFFCLEIVTPIKFTKI